MRRGFTLVEVVIALAVSGLVVAQVAVIWTGLLSASRALGAQRQQLERRMNGERWLAEALRSAEAGDTGQSTFAGTPLQAKWTGRIWVAGGWRERRRLMLRWERHQLVLHGGDEAVPIGVRADTAFIDYLTSAGLTSTWTPSFESPVSLPVALRIRLAVPDSTLGWRVDTMLVAVGPRP